MNIIKKWIEGVERPLRQLGDAAIQYAARNKELDEMTTFADVADIEFPALDPSSIVDLSELTPRELFWECRKAEARHSDALREREKYAPDTAMWEVWAQRTCEFFQISVKAVNLLNEIFSDLEKEN